MDRRIHEPHLRDDSYTANLAVSVNAAAFIIPDRGYAVRWPVIKSYGADDDTGSPACTTCEPLSLSCPESAPCKESNDSKGSSLDTPSVDVPSGMAKAANT